MSKVDKNIVKKLLFHKWAFNNYVDQFDTILTTHPPRVDQHGYFTYYIHTFCSRRQKLPPPLLPKIEMYVPHLKQHDMWVNLRTL